MKKDEAKSLYRLISKVNEEHSERLDAIEASLAQRDKIITFLMAGERRLLAENRTLLEAIARTAIRGAGLRTQ